MVAAASAPWIFAAWRALVRRASRSLVAYRSRLRMGSVNGEVVSGVHLPASARFSGRVRRSTGGLGGGWSR